MSWRWWITGLFLAGIAAFVVVGRLPQSVLAVYIGASFAAYFAYSYDKAAAQAQHRRIRERTLHLLALIGGWPGALVAQQRFRHKWQKTRFLIGFWTTVLLNSCILGWWLR